MKTMLRRCFALMLTAVFVLSCSIPVFAADGMTTVGLDVTFQQTDARRMLAMVNDFRTGTEAWYWNVDDQTKTDLTGQLQAFTYDYNLEQVAMQRAAEIVLHYAHTRPNNASCFTAFQEFGANGRAVAENIAVGYLSVEDVFAAWQETNENYAGQGHRRNMLSSDTTSIGIARVVYQGVNYWVQEFGHPFTPNTTPTQPNDTATTVEMDVSSDVVQQVSISQDIPALSLEVGSRVALPTVEAELTTTETWEYTPPVFVTVTPNWSVTSSGVAEVRSDGTLVAQGAGSTSLTAEVLGQTVTVPVTVTGTSLASATVTLEQDTYTYTGQPITPAVTVVLRDATLTQGTDYTVTYENNTQVGTATVIVTGIGSYTGTVTKPFTISNCAHQWDNGVDTTPATCSTEGVRTYTCTLCHATRTEPISKLPHTPVIDPAVPPTCTHTGLTQGSHCSVCGEILEAQAPVDKLPHDYVETILTPATCTTDGEAQYTCSLCGDHYTQAIPALGHRFGEWITISSPSCTQNGSQQRTCSTCGFIETKDVDPTGHTWAEEYTVDQAPTCTQDGSQSIHCTLCDAVTDVQVIPATGHSWDEGEVTVPPTCTQPGKIHHTCTVCGETSDDILPATGHTWGEETILTPATCTQDGLLEHTCLVCSQTETVPIPATGHQYEEVVTPATCTQGGYTTHTCTVCGVSHIDTLTDPLGHTFQWVVDQQPTATQPGSRHQVCSVCGAQGAVEPLSPTGTPNPSPQDKTQITVGNQQTQTTVGGVSVTVNNPTQAFDLDTILSIERVHSGPIYTTAQQALKNLVTSMDSTAIFEFTAMRGGVAVQPKSALSVTFALPSNLTAENLKMYYITQDGKYEAVPISVDATARTVTARLEHFSTYVLANPTQTSPTISSPQTGDHSHLLLYVMSLSVASVGLVGAWAIWMKKRSH